MSLTPDSNDQEILERTLQDDQHIWVELDDGHIIKAAKPMKFTEWCAAVRDNVATRIQYEEQERRALRQREDLDSDVEEADVRRDPRAVPGPEDPLEFARAERERWLARLHQLKEQALEIQQGLETANSHFTKWNKVLEVLDDGREVLPDSGDGGEDHRSGVPGGNRGNPDGHQDDPERGTPA